MSKKQIFLDGLMGKMTERIPVFNAMQTATYDQMDELNAHWPEAHFESKPMANLAKGAHTILGFDAVRVPFCLTVESEMFGCEIKSGGEKRCPAVASTPYGIDDKPSTRVSDFKTKGRVSEVCEAVAILQSEIGNEVAVLGGVNGPLSLAMNLVDSTELLISTKRAPEKVEYWLQLATSAISEFSHSLVSSGADAIVITEMLPLSMIGPQIFIDYAVPGIQNIVADLDVPAILHICGNSDPLIDALIETDIACLNIDIMTDAKAAKDKIKTAGKKITLAGGVDVQKALLDAEDDELTRQQVHEAVKSGYDLISASCDIIPNTKIDRLKAMVDEAHKIKPKYE